MKAIEKFLGMNVRDRVTGMTGIITAMSFDLYGCTQALLNPGLDKDGQPRERYWYDVSRLEILSEVRVMPLPGFKAAISNGPENKPSQE